MSDCLDLHVAAEIFQVCFGSCNCCNTGTREADFWCWCKFIYKIRISCFCTCFKDFYKEVLIVIIEMMNAVCVIPVDTEIRCCRFQMRKALYCFCWISISLWVGVFRHTPDSFDGCVFTDKLLYHIHVWSLWCHWHVDHFDSEEFCDLEMAVISRYRTEEFYLIKFAPWGISHYTLCHRTCNAVKHNV